jgi:bifunctional non-homologous end joining protein LigD
MLEPYRAKRNFRKSPEPRGGKPSSTGRSFVVQKHAASQLHYDFRLELDGVLKSWAVPKGPSLDPADRRLAVHVEDHPVEYGGFEGVIPEGEYGGGTVMLWDRGEWVPQDNARTAYKQGRLKFHLKGSKLRGGWHLVRIAGKPGERRENWLLIKENDAEARPGDQDGFLAEAEWSVATGRSLAEIAGERDRVWSSAHGEVTPEGPAGRAPSAAPDPSRLPGARKARLAAQPPRPVLATLVAEAPASEDWLHEIKFDGYRLLARVARSGVRLHTRNAQDWTDRFPAIGEALRELTVTAALIDGEVVALRPDGTTSFQDLQRGVGAGAELVFIAFDLLHLDGYDLRGASLLERKRMLQVVVPPGSGPVRYSEHVIGQGPSFFQNACRLGLEGIISKRVASPYGSGRGRDWLKVKCLRRESFVIGGFTEPQGSRQGFGALLVGSWTDAGTLTYRGKVGTGFNAALLRALRRRLDGLRQDRPPFLPPPPRADRRGAIWVRPLLVAEVAFTEITRDGVLRHPSFQGLREDLEPEDASLPQALPAAPDLEHARARDAGPGRAPRGRRVGERARGAVSQARTGSGARELAVAGERLTSPDKVLYPEQGITKLQLARHYELVADLMLPHVRRRPLTLVRCPEGHTGSCFFQKRAGDVVSSSVKRVRVRDAAGEDPYLFVDSLRGLVALVQLGVLELHCWNARTDRLDRPDQLVFDLDPGPDVLWERVAEAALLLRIRLGELGLESFVKTTGGKGLHVVAPIVRRHGWDVVKEFTRAVCEEQVRRAPGQFTTRVAKKARRGKVYLDYLRNAREATAVAPYSTRARPAAPVSIPITWDELAAGRVDPADLRVDSLPGRLAADATDPWAGLPTLKQSLTTAALRELGVR